MKSYDLYLILLEFAFSIGLYFLAGYAEKVKSTKWKLLYITPLVICVGFIAFTGEEISLLGVYVAALVLLIGFSNETPRVRRISSAISALLIIPALIVCNINPGYRAPNYLKEFKDGFDMMKEHYCLSEYKNIDWDALYEEYEPRFKEVQKNHDAVENYIVWTEFLYNFHDGHVAYITRDIDAVKEAMVKMYGNDYGLSLMTLADGKTVAVNVEEGSDIYKAGIHNGTVITSWDGKTIAELVGEKEMFYCMVPYNQVKENDAFYQAAIAAGRGGDVVTINFIADDGTLKSVDAVKLGAYRDRLDATLKILMYGISASNLTWHECTEDTVILRLTDMIYDTNAEQTGDYSTMKEEVKEEMLKQKDKGVKNIIIDIRNNAGGDPGFIIALCELFSPEGEYDYAYSGVWDEEKNEWKYDKATGKYVVGKGTAYEGENVWGNGQIVLLVSSSTISAGDHFIQLMSVLDNVTIIGFTSSNCSGQAVRGEVYEVGGVQFSSVPTLYEDGSIYIDLNDENQKAVPLDIRVPFDEQAVKAMFDDGKDYLVEYAKDYIEGK